MQTHNSCPALERAAQPPPGHNGAARETATATTALTRAGTPQL